MKVKLEEKNYWLYSGVTWILNSQDYQHPLLLFNGMLMIYPWIKECDSHYFLERLKELQLTKRIEPDNRKLENMVWDAGHQKERNNHSLKFEKLGITISSLFSTDTIDIKIGNQSKVITIGMNHWKSFIMYLLEDIELDFYFRDTDLYHQSVLEKALSFLLVN